MGVLSGLKIIEMGAIGPVPFAGMLLSDMGAEEDELIAVRAKITKLDEADARTIHDAALAHERAGKVFMVDLTHRFYAPCVAARALCAGVMQRAVARRIAHHIVHCL